MNLNEAKQILNKNGYILEDMSVALNERVYDGPTDKVYTGLADNGAYHNIISSVRGQIYDGIGEGSGREGRIFNYYFKSLIDDYDVDSTSENGEFVVTGNCIADYDGIELLTNCIWRIASIERKDIGTNDKNINYDYLRGANWSDICKLCGALTNIRKKDEKTEPWSDEKKAKYEAIKKAEEEKRIAEEEAKKKAEEEQKQKELDAKNETIKIMETYPTDAKDKKRAKDALSRSSEWFIHYYKLLARQLDKITDVAKWNRRIAAFYQLAKDHSWKDQESTCEFYMNCMIDLFNTNIRI